MHSCWPLAAVVSFEVQTPFVTSSRTINALEHNYYPLGLETRNADLRENGQQWGAASSTRRRWRPTGRCPLATRLYMCSFDIHSVVLVVTLPQQANTFAAEHSTGNTLLRSACSWWRTAGWGLLGETPVDAPIQWSPQAVAALVLACFCALLANSAVRRPVALWLPCVLTALLEGRLCSHEVP